MKGASNSGVDCTDDYDVEEAISCFMFSTLHRESEANWYCSLFIAATSSSTFLHRLVRKTTAFSTHAT